ncbi:hypothetical protein EBB07_29200 [Paenibacillaceae bacterium]|nr:hypothetical protein EBB07_29200 [Paenibacillaceae bacterium]
MIKEIFENVFQYENTRYGESFAFSLDIEQFARKLNVFVGYIDSKSIVDDFQPPTLEVSINVTGELIYRNEIETLVVLGNVSFIDGVLKFKNFMHPDSKVVVRVYDNLDNEQVRKLLSHM